jgi:hypothetical protein
MPKLPLTQKLVSKAIDAKREAEVRDASTPGLMLRVRASGAWTWSLRVTLKYRDYRRDLGDDWTLDEARKIVSEVNGMERWTRFDTITEEARWTDWLGRKRARRSGEVYVAPPPPPEPATGQTWRDAQAAWIVDFRERRRETTAYGYDMALKVAEFVPLHDRVVSRVTRIDVSEVVAAIAKRGAERQAELSAHACRKMFEWLGMDAQTRKYGVAPGIMKDLQAPERRESETDDENEKASTHVPDGAEIGAILRWLREDHGLERDRLAGLLLLYTAQRRRAVACARQGDFRDVDGVPCWLIPPMHRKSASILKRKGKAVHAHVVPLPPAALAVVQRAKEVAEKDEWLFPGVRPRRADAPVSHMHPSLITHLYKKIPGSEAKPHDVRRAFGTTYKKLAKLSLSDVKLILDHSEDTDPDDVTVKHYTFDPRLPEKTPIMAGWCAWVDDQAG